MTLWEPEEKAFHSFIQLRMSKPVERWFFFFFYVLQAAAFFHDSIKHKNGSQRIFQVLCLLLLDQQLAGH